MILPHHQRPGIPPGFVPPLFGDAPVGAVIAFAGQLQHIGIASPPSAPDPGFPVTGAIEAWGWTPCDGRPVLIHDYPELYAALGKLYGGDATHFCVPDYRGIFLRGADTGTANDPDMADRTNAAGPGALPEKQNGVGSRQDHAMQTHEHIYGSDPKATQPAPQGDVAGAPSPTPQLTTQGPTSSLNPPGLVKVSRHETRPINVYVHYLIKFTYRLRVQAPTY